jgi:F-type H+-transporting ATPase subunit b
MKHVRPLALALLLAGVAVLAVPPAHAATAAFSAAAGAVQPPPEHAAAPDQEDRAAREAAQAEQGEESHGGEWLAVIAKAFNFALLVGVLVYFLRTPLSGYLAGRITKVREDLVTAAEMRDAATRQLADIEAKLEALPGELEALKARGAEEIAAERVRIERAAEDERQRLLEHTRREIDMRLRIARRDLIEYAATLAVDAASAKIKSAITPEDQGRLVDRYTSQLGAADRGEARA